ncbi:hypothetical protein [Anaeromicrobium sediminis]|uniref:Uncharacterized protein n=1 Tax=Anaeromicrobium sediminis TaxID=1478221 RepID=A0A267MLV2_9FIRM|nr:hypothetical protein [Anaeromicrobium sediminis]PAB60382.1 hypothetical protein CCE28_05665 [Anaeromicrobium sediminis]
MQSLYKYSDRSINKLEIMCTSIIEDDLDMFFNSCKKSAYAYSVMIAKDINKYDFSTFEKLVISSEEVEIIVNKIIKKLNMELERHIEYVTFNLENHNTILEGSINSFKITQKLTKTCEKIINIAFSKTLKNIYNNFAANFMFKKVNLGEKVLGKNSYKSQIKLQQEKIYNQIEGMLINIKVDIRNQLIEEAIRNIHNIQEQKSYAIA